VVSEDAERRAYAYCERVARNHYENFPVASLLLPAHMRPHVAAIYAFARTADDFADEPGLADEERVRLLDDWGRRLCQAAGCHAADLQFPTPNFQVSNPNTDVRPELIFAALGATIRQCRLPVQLFEDLLSAFRQDVTTRRYGTWDDVLDYCRRSANPVGRLVLRVAGHADAGLDAASDAVCTALQLTNFWQDLGRDWTQGRLYVPQADLAEAGALEADLDERRMTAPWQAVIGSMVQRTRALFAAGRRVCDGVQGRLRWELRLTWLGGVRILDKVERVRSTSFDARPALAARDVPALIRDAILWPGT
jgi:squalene synthase HpnC